MRPSFLFSLCVVANERLRASTSIVNSSQVGVVVFGLNQIMTLTSILIDTDRPMVYFKQVPKILAIKVKQIKLLDFGLVPRWHNVKPQCLSAWVISVFWKYKGQFSIFFGCVVGKGWKGNIALRFSMVHLWLSKFVVCGNDWTRLLLCALVFVICGKVVCKWYLRNI